MGGGKAALAVAGAHCLRTWKKAFRKPVLLIFSLAQPLMWMLFFGFLFHRYALEGGSGAATYLEFLLPGVCVMTVLFGASQSGVGLIRDMQSGFLARLLQTPASVPALIGGKIAADVARLLGQAILVGLLGLALGARPHPAAGPLAAAVLLLVLFAAAYASLSCWIALKTRSQETMGVFIQAANMPILFTSTALVPVKHMPDWLAGLAAANPVTLAVDPLRAALLAGPSAAHWPAWPALAAAACLLFALAAREMAKSRSA